MKCCSLREIIQAYRILHVCFKTLTYQHLQLIKKVVKRSNVIHTMKNADLYSRHDRRHFQELRDNITIRFQLQELKNDDDDEAELLNQRSIQVSALAASAQQQQNNEPIDDVPLKEIKQFYIRFEERF
ncbi:unnamed protein product [Rotaria sp. Silwood1]|nr:unnamed protein product [Rotaria sp. Silwood1]